MTEWFSDNAWWLTATTIAGLLGCIAVTLVLAVLLPADHFTQADQRTPQTRRHPVVHILLRVVRNVVGGILLLVGIVMAIPAVPGPGILFILLGLSLTDMPGKHSLVRYVVSRPAVLRPINALRTRWNRPPLQLSQDQQGRR